MAIFGFGKKKEEKKACSCSGGCGCGCGAEVKSEVKVLGGGCAKCDELEKITVQALAELGMETAVEHVRDFAVIATYGVMATPALVVDGKVLLSGRVPKKDEVVALIKNIRTEK